MQQRRGLWARALSLAAVLAVLGTWLWIEATPQARVAPPAGKAIAIDRSAPAQSERKALIDRLVADGLVRRIDPERNGILKVSLRPAFYTLDPATRHSHVDAIYRYYFDGSNVNDAVVLRDARNGNEVGRYNPYQGGLNMYK